MKWILALLLISFELKAACTSATRSNFSANQVLTSSRLNSEFNSIVSTLNAYDGGCISAGSVEAAALNSTEFAPIVKVPVSGCEVTYVDSNTVGVSKCKIAVDGNLFETASQSNVTWGCSNCSSEATGSYYVYIKDSSTFTPFFSTTAPGKDGYNGTDKAIGFFYNTSGLDIATNSIAQFVQSGFLPVMKNVPRAGQNIVIMTALVQTTGTVSNEDEDFIKGNCTNADPQVCTFMENYWASAPKCLVMSYGPTNAFCYNATADTTTSMSMACTDNAGGTSVTTYNKKILCVGAKNGP